MAFQRGKSKTGGRKKGTPNRMSGAAREAFALAFEGVGGVDGLQEWARTHPTEFYRLYARLIPVEVKTVERPVGGVLRVPMPMTVEEWEATYSGD